MTALEYAYLLTYILTNMWYYTTFTADILLATETDYCRNVDETIGVLNYRMCQNNTL